jgi:GxxExxY protein
MQMDYKYSDLTEAIIKCFYKVYNELGYGFLEKVYHNALLIELQNEELKVESQKPIKVSYQGDVVGEYYKLLKSDRA